MNAYCVWNEGHTHQVWLMFILISLMALTKELNTAVMKTVSSFLLSFCFTRASLAENSESLSFSGVKNCSNMFPLKWMRSVWWKMSADASPKSRNGANVDVQLNQLYRLICLLDHYWQRVCHIRRRFSPEQSNICPAADSLSSFQIANCSLYYCFPKF